MKQVLDASQSVFFLQQMNHLYVRDRSNLAQRSDRFGFRRFVNIVNQRFVKEDKV